MNLASPLTDIKGIGPALAVRFAKLGIETVLQLINYYPRRYDDYSQLSPIKSLKPGAVSIEAQIKQVKGRYVRRGMHVTEAIASDNSGSVRLIWFNQPYRAGAIKTGETYYISGLYELRRQRFSIQNPSLEVKSDMPINTARILAVYPETKGLTSRQIRQAIFATRYLIKDFRDPLPESVVNDNKLISKSDAITMIHMPRTTKEVEIAKRRLGFEEVLQLSLASLLNKYENQSETSLTIPFNEKLAREFVGHLPFKLTNAQRKIVWQIYLDMQKSQPMNRLVEGDVGSGKTVVAAMAALMAMEQGFQVAFMAPTELLARQHAEVLHDLLDPLGKSDLVTFLVGSHSSTQKSTARKSLAQGYARMVIGTHTLIQNNVDMHKLGLVIIDEQHRFGVEQRKSLMAKAGHMPHVLNMTATPIPRSLALTLYGELDVSVLDEMPRGRKPVKTKIISPNSSESMYESIESELEAGRQMFVVCPLISESDSQPSKSVEKVYKELSSKRYKHRSVGLLHGKLSAQDKESVMRNFLFKKIDILVSTTVIEVGVDIPNATVMIIENAERFGLAQLHQLRGRIGRGENQGYCYLLLGDSNPPSNRLRALESSSDGFKLAELDLELRGPGAIYGTMQHGQLDLRVAKLSDTKLISEARASAQKMIDDKVDLLKYPELMKKVNRLRTVTNLN